MPWLPLAMLVALSAHVVAGEDAQSGERTALDAALAREVTMFAESTSWGLSSGGALFLAEAHSVLLGNLRDRARAALLAPGKPQEEDSIIDAINITVLAWRVTGDAGLRSAAAGVVEKAEGDTAAEWRRTASADAPRMVAALAAAGCALGLPGPIAVARKLSASLHEARWTESVGLTGLAGNAEAADYDALIAAQLVLYQATGDMAALDWALQFQGRLDRDFWDEEAGMYRGDAPSAALDLVRLGRITDDDAFTNRARRLIATARADGTIFAVTESLLAAWIEDASPVLHLTLIGGVNEPGTAALLTAAHRSVVPGFAITILDESDACRALRQRFPGMPLMPREGKAPTAYLCTATACDPPTTDPARLAQRIAELSQR